MDWVPLGLTFLVIKLLIDLMDRTLVLTPASYRPGNLDGFNIPDPGVALTVLVVIATGIVFANVFGRELARIWEVLLARIPLVLSFYSLVKRITETLFPTRRGLINIYLAAATSPTSGFFLMAPQRDIIELEMSVEVGLKVILSTGVVVPEPNQVPSELPRVANMN